MGRGFEPRSPHHDLPANIAPRDLGDSRRDTRLDTLAGWVFARYQEAICPTLNGMTWLRAALAATFLCVGLACAFVMSQVETTTGPYHCGSWSDPVVTDEDVAELYPYSAGALETIQHECEETHWFMMGLTGLSAGAGVAAGIAAWVVAPMVVGRVRQESST